MTALAAVPSLFSLAAPILLLIASNVFMTFAGGTDI